MRVVVRNHDEFKSAESLVVGTVVIDDDEDMFVKVDFDAWINRDQETWNNVEFENYVTEPVTIIYQPATV